MVRKTTDFSDLDNWIDRNLLPMVGLWDFKTSSIYKKQWTDFHTPLVQLWYNLDPLKPKTPKYVANRLRRVAERFKGQALFSYTNMTEEITQFHVKQWEAKQYSLTIICRFGKFIWNDVFREGKIFKIDGAIKFINSALKGEFEEILTSETVPNTPMQNGLTTLVGETIMEEVFQERPAFIKFYAPWCQHCKALKPVWERLAWEIKDEDILIADYDATNNDVPSTFDVRAFPSLYLRTKTGDVEKYNGNRDVDSMKQYLYTKGAISEHASHSYEEVLLNDKSEL